MAKRDLSRNLPAKKYSHSNPTELRLSFEFSGNTTRYIDLARCLSTINRKFFSQQAYYYVSKVELYNNEDAFVDIHTLPDTWVTKNAYRRGRAMFEKMNGLLDPAVSGLASAPYYDFKVFMSDRHRTQTDDVNPVTYDINAAPNAEEPDEWRYSQLISADSDGDGTANLQTGAVTLTQEADNFYLHMLGGHAGSSANWASVGLVQSYQDSRSTVSTGADEAHTDITDPLMNLFDTSTEEQINDVAQRLIFDNDGPPYAHETYVGSNVGMAQQARLVTSDPANGGRRIDQAPGFCAPLGLICIDPQSTASLYRIVITMAPGTYHGVYAERV